MFFEGVVGATYGQYTVFPYEYTVYLPCINRVSTVIDSVRIEGKQVSFR